MGLQTCQSCGGAGQPCCFGTTCNVTGQTCNTTTQMCMSCGSAVGQPCCGANGSQITNSNNYYCAPGSLACYNGGSWQSVAATDSATWARSLAWDSGGRIHVGGTIRAAGVSTPNRYVTIHSGMNIEAFLNAHRDDTLRESLGISRDDLVVGKIARLFRLKGHEFLFEAASRICRTVPNVKFLLVGDGIYRERIERLVEERGLRSHFVFAGLVSPSEIPRYVALMDVLVHLSLREGLPRALPQALACGKPVVAFDMDGAREVCLDGQTGFLVRAEDVPGLSAAVIRLLQDKELAHRMGTQGRELVQEQFSEARMVKQLDELYRRLSAVRD